MDMLVLLMRNSYISLLYVRVTAGNGDIFNYASMLAHRIQYLVPIPNETSKISNVR